MNARNNHLNRPWQRFSPIAAVAAGLFLAGLLLAAAAITSPSPTVLANSAPATPSSVSLTRADGAVTADWTADSAATKWHVAYSDDGGGSWHAPVDDNANVLTNTLTFNVDNSKSYIVGVRAGNNHGWSGWRNSPQAGPYTPSTPPATPGTITITRDDGTLDASWAAVAGAAKYHITYSNDNKQSWQAAPCGANCTGASITINNADNSKTYVVAVRAGNDAGWSGWRNSDPAGPYTTPPSAPESVTVTRADGTLTASWPAVSDATKYHITYSSDGKHSWNAASDSHASNSITIAAANGKTYHVAVRAGNDAGWSGWTNSAASVPTDPPGIIVQDTSGNAITALSISEGGEASYQVKLASQPAANVEVCIGLSVRDRNDSSITFKGEAEGTVAIKVPFTPDNWDTAQTVTLVAAEDDDDVNGVRDVINDTRDYVEYFSGSVWLAVTEVDND